jgi:hypothetical protein
VNTKPKFTPKENSGKLRPRAQARKDAEIAAAAKAAEEAAAAAAAAAAPASDESAA